MVWTVSLMSVVWSSGLNWWFNLLQYSSGVVWHPRDLYMFQHIPAESSSLLHYRLHLYLFSVMIVTSWQHAYIMLTLLNLLIYSTTGVYRGKHYFSYSAQNIDCGYLLEPPCRVGSNEYPQSMFWAEIWKISDFVSENFHFFGGKSVNIFE